MAEIPRRTSPGVARHSRRCDPRGGAGWLNHPVDYQAEDAVRAAHSPNYDRLVAVKRQDDSDNVFRLCRSIVS